MNRDKKNDIATIAIVGSLILTVILVAGTVWMGSRAKRDTEEAVRSVSLLYLDELAGRREQVVGDNLREKIQTIRAAIDLMTEEDTSDKAHMEAYQSRMKQLYHLDKFAFVDTEGLIYTSTGTQNDIEKYSFDYRALSEPEISIFNPESPEKRVIIAVPVNILFEGKTLSVCFMEISMEEMLSGISLRTCTALQASLMVGKMTSARPLNLRLSTVRYVMFEIKARVPSDPMIRCLMNLSPA